MSNDDEHFLRRWSRRKVEARQPAAEAPAPARGGQPGEAPPDGAAPAAKRVPESPPSETATPHRSLTEDDFADVDFEKLDFNSDYARFMQKGVPESIRQKALRQLWSSDPVFSAVEPFNEYGGDFTDAAVAVAPGTLQTAWRFGKGLLTDEEAAEWEALGKPESETAATAEATGAPAQPEEAAGPAPEAEAHAEAARPPEAPTGDVAAKPDVPSGATSPPEPDPEPPTAKT